MKQRSSQTSTGETPAEAGRLKLITSDDSARWHVPVLVLLASVVFLWRLGAVSLADWDEAIYAQVSKEMLRGGDWLTPRWNGELWFEKPPLLMWTTAVFYRLFGVGEFWSRAASAFSGVGVVVLTYSMGRLVYGRRVGFLAALVLLTSYQFVSAGRFGTIDMLLTLFTYLAVYAYLRLLAGGDGRWWYLLWLGCALALMSKGAAGWVAPVSIALALLLNGSASWASMRSSHFWQGLVLALAVVLPWHLLMYARYGQAFVGEYVGYHVVARSTRALEGHAESYLFYLARLVDGFFPWVLLLPFAVVAAARENMRRRSHARTLLRPHSLVLLLLPALVFLFYTAIPTKLLWYILPVYPACALLVAAFAGRAYARRPRVVLSVCALFVLVGGAYCLLLISLRQRGDEPLARLARLARRADAGDREALLLFSDAEPLYRPAALFYSDRPLRQVYSKQIPASQGARRYYDFQSLHEAAGDSQQRIILRRDDIERLSAQYEIRVLAEADALVYATVKRKE